MHAIDTHKAVTRLETAGMSRQTAEAVVEIFDTAANAAAADLATKADVKDLGAKLESLGGRVENLERNMATKADVRDLDAKLESLGGRVENLERNMATKADIAEVKIDIVRWNVGLIVAVAALMIAAVKLL